MCCCCVYCVDCINKIIIRGNIRRRYRENNRVNRNRVNENKSYIQYIMSKDREHKKLEGTCCICLETITKNKSLLECNHIFHKKCLEKWKKKTENEFNCPLCRQKISTIIQINN